MRQKIQWLLVIPLLISLASCNQEGDSSLPSSTPDTQDSSPTSSTDSSSGPSLDDFIDYVHNGSVALNLEYEGRTFVEDGIEEVSLATCIDGDTAHFYDANNNRIKSRYYGIDTPESTGSVQPYGRGASNFNKEKLQEADEHGTIVITGTTLDTYEAPTHDSTGERYVTLVWVNTEVEHADPSELVLLNLWIVQDGWSYVKNVASIPQFADIFYAAEAQATTYKLNLFSGEDDPLYNYGDYKDVSIFDIKEEMVKNLEDPTYENKYNNAKVRIRGTVAGYSNNILYVNQYDAETDTYAGVNFYTGMSSISSKYTKSNAYIEACGLGLESENFGFQLTDGNFSIWSTDDNAAQVIVEADENTDELTQLRVAKLAPTELEAADYDYLNTAVKLTEEVKVYGGYVDDSATEFTLYLQDLNGNRLPYSLYIPFQYRLNNGSNGTSNGTRFTSIDEFKEYTFVLNFGIYTFHKSATSGNISWQINLCSLTDFQPAEFLDTEE